MSRVGRGPTYNALLFKILENKKPNVPMVNVVVIVIQKGPITVLRYRNLISYKAKEVQSRHSLMPDKMSSAASLNVPCLRTAIPQNPIYLRLITDIV